LSFHCLFPFFDLVKIVRLQLADREAYSCSFSWLEFYWLCGVCTACAVHILAGKVHCWDGKPWRTCSCCIAHTRNNDRLSRTEQFQWNYCSCQCS